MIERGDPYQEVIAAAHLATSLSKAGNEDSEEEERAVRWMLGPLLGVSVVLEYRRPG